MESRLEIAGVGFPGRAIIQPNDRYEEAGDGVRSQLVCFQRGFRGRFTFAERWDQVTASEAREIPGWAILETAGGTRWRVYLCRFEAGAEGTWAEFEGSMTEAEAEAEAAI